jgi:leucyl-tRNA synthetase
MLFNHCALLQPEHWPKGYGVNGWVTVDGQKMSKSLGNVIPVRTMVSEFGADASRLTILNGGEGMDDPNWDSELARATRSRFEALLETCREHAKDGSRTRHEHEPVDDWMQSKLHRAIKDSTDAMDKAFFRTAMQFSWFGLSNTIKQYVKLSGEKPHAAVMRSALETQIKMIQPFAPHIAAECWEALGNKTALANEEWPAFDEALISDEIEASQDLVQQLASDIRNVKELIKKTELTSVTVIVAQSWLYKFAQELRDSFSETRDVRALIAKFTKEYSSRAGDVTKMIPMLVKDPSRLPSYNTSQEVELRAVSSAAGFLGKQFGCSVTVVRAEESSEKKALSAFPGKPAIMLE